MYIYMCVCVCVMMVIIYCSNISLRIASQHTVTLYTCVILQLYII